MYVAMMNMMMMIVPTEFRGIWRQRYVGSTITRLQTGRLSQSAWGWGIGTQKFTDEVRKPLSVFFDKNRYFQMTFLCRHHFYLFPVQLSRIIQYNMWHVLCASKN